MNTELKQDKKLNDLNQDKTLNRQPRFKLLRDKTVTIIESKSESRVGRTAWLAYNRVLIIAEHAEELAEGKQTAKEDDPSGHHFLE